MRLLVVEDEAKTANFLAKGLGESGFAVDVALNGLDGRKSGTAAEYSYSEANKNSGITWSAATFKDYIQNPMAKVPGTKMAFAGIKNEKEIGDLWAYLKQFKADGSK